MACSDPFWLHPQTLCAAVGSGDFLRFSCHPISEAKTLLDGATRFVQTTSFNIRRTVLALRPVLAATCR